MLSDLDLRAMNIFYFLKTLTFLPQMLNFFKRQGLFSLCFQLVQEVVSHYYKPLFCKSPTHIPTFPSFIGIVDTCGLRCL